MSIPPNLAATFLTISFTSADFATSHRTNIASCPDLLISSTTLWPRSSCISATAILAPSVANSFAIALPMFLPAPVMSATCPLSFTVLFLSERLVSLVHAPISNFEIFRRSRRIDIESVQRAGQHRIVADGCGELDHALFAEAAIDRLERRLADSMGMDHLAHEADDLCLFGGKILHAPFLIDSANGFHGNAGLLTMVDVRRPLMFAFELPRRHQRRELNDFMIQARFKPNVTAEMHCALRHLRAVQQRQPRSADDAAACSDRFIDFLIFRGQVFFLINSSNACHVAISSLRSPVVIMRVSLSAT